MVDVFADGHIGRDSIALEERKGDACPSLVDGPFLKIVDRILLDVVTSEDFEALWERGTDSPFWFPDGCPDPAES